MDFSWRAAVDVRSRTLILHARRVAAVIGPRGRLRNFAWSAKVILASREGSGYVRGVRCWGRAAESSNHRPTLLTQVDPTNQGADMKYSKYLDSGTKMNGILGVVSGLTITIASTGSLNLWCALKQI